MRNTMATLIATLIIVTTTITITKATDSLYEISDRVDEMIGYDTTDYFAYTVLIEQYHAELPYCLLDDATIDRTGIPFVFNGDCDGLLRSGGIGTSLPLFVADYVMFKEAGIEVALLIYTNPKSIRERFKINKFIEKYVDFDMLLEDLVNVGYDQTDLPDSTISSADSNETIINKLKIPEEEIYNQLDKLSLEQLKVIRKSLTDLF